MPLRDYIEKAKEVLDKNWTGEYTVPSVHLYPHQWNWDSGFIAIGYSRYNMERATRELLHLFEAQWKNGMLPQIVFNKNALGRYFPEPDFWQTDLSPNAPKNVLTSGITMPPIHGYAVLKMYENAREKDRLIPFLKFIYPKIIKLHEYLYLERNPDDNGLIYIRHPWESGMDNSPMWDPVLNRIDITKVKIPEFERKDNKIIDPEQRPKDIDYKRYIYLVDIFRKNRYDEKKIFEECPFIVIDPLFNSILCASNEALVQIADIIKEDYKKPEEWFLMTARAVRDNLFSSEKKIFFAYDYIQKELIEVETAAGFMPLFGGIASTQQALKLYEHLDSLSFCRLGEKNCFAIPNYDKKKKDFSPHNYWRGPVWININWMLYQGLLRYKFKQKAEHLEITIMELPMRFGFYEYFDSFTGKGYGTKDFSWTAALFIDLAYDMYEKSEKKWETRSFGKEIILNINGEHLPVEDVEEIKKDFFCLTGKIIEKYTRNGTVNYDAIRLSPEYKLLQNTISKFANKDILKFDSKEEEMAFWINLYNMMVIDAIIRLNIQGSVKEIEGFFTNIKYRINGKDYSLDDIREILRKFGDKRVPFALVKGTNSSPPLRLFTKKNIKSKLNSAARDFIRSPEVIILPEEKKILISELFRWNEHYFKDKDEIINFIKKYVKDDTKREFLDKEDDIEIRYLLYDWTLNG
ncbi:MGH1-like glycoside hydrolase domain-containing protein [Persephonella sp.]